MSFFWKELIFPRKLWYLPQSFLKICIFFTILRQNLNFFHILWQNLHFFYLLFIKFVFSCDPLVKFTFIRDPSTKLVFFFQSFHEICIFSAISWRSLHFFRRSLMKLVSFQWSFVEICNIFKWYLLCLNLQTKKKFFFRNLMF